MEVSECCGSIPWNDTNVCLECMKPADFIDYVEYNTKTLLKERVMNITGMMDIGTGEKCPHCDLINEKDTDILKHLMEKHPKEFNKTFLKEMYNE